MALYLGYYRPVPKFVRENQTRERDQGSGVNTTFQQRVRELPEQLPAGCVIGGSYVPVGVGPVLGDPGPPPIMVVETDNPADLTFICRYYAGYLMFQWTPGMSIGATRVEREAAAMASPVGNQA